MPRSAGRLVTGSPLDAIACLPNVLNYFAYPEKVPSRLKAIGADYNSVRHGFPWSMLRTIASELEVDFVLPELDVLTPYQILQVKKLQDLSPKNNVNLTIVEGADHLMTARPKLVAEAMYPSALPEAA